MPIQRLRSLQSLYAEVADHDLVIVPNNPLADAIDRRVETPQFGTFATTPRRLATGRREAAEDRTAFLEVVERSDHSWKAIAYAIGNVLQCWEHRGSADAIRDFPAFVDEPTEDVLQIMADLRTTSGELSDYEIPEDRSVAVLGYEQLTPLERSIIPDSAERIDLFEVAPFDLPPFHIFDSSRAIVDALLDTVTAETAAEVAVVLDQGSRYSSLVESALEAADIPFYGGPGFVDDPDHRAFLQLLRTAYRGSETTIGEVRSICTQVGIDIPVEHDQKRLDEADIPQIEWIAEFVGAVDEGKTGDALDTADDGVDNFADALDRYERKAGRSLDPLREELANLGLLHAHPSEDRVQDLEYYLQTYEIPVDRDDEGVLLADATAAGYVDRPVVFFLGMGEGWTHTAPQRPWVDTDALYERHLRQFQALLQSGTEQYYLVEDTVGGEPVTPCLYFGELLDEDFERFSDLESVEHTRPSHARPMGFEQEEIDVEPTSLDTISQSSLNSYVNSPRDYLFSHLLESPDRDYFREGTLFHDFAEFYVNHAERIGEAELEEVVSVMLEEAGPFFTDTDRPLRRRKYRIGLETIVEYLDAHSPEAHDFLTPDSGWGRNFFAEYFDEPVDSPLTERWFENTAIGAKGKIDLVRAPDHLVDYKSGHKRSEYRVVQGAAIDPPDDTPNFQAALYLSHFRTVQPDRRIEFTFFHFLETLDDVITGNGNLEDTLTTVTYYPETFDEFYRSMEAYDVLLDGPKDCVATFEDLGFEAYSAITSELSFPETTEKEELRESAFAEAFTAAVVAETSSDVDAEYGSDQAIRRLNRFRRRAFFEEDLNAFEAFLADTIEAINRYRAGEGRFPVDGPGGEPNYRRVHHRDLLVERE